MSMALKADLIKTSLDSGCDKPIDLVFLSSMTMGDKHLEAEILNMFSSQLPVYIDELFNADGPDSARRTGHTLKGAARSVGALRLAEIAEEFETGHGGNQSALLAEAGRIQAYIRSLHN